jgi:putative transcriptional regulator
MSKVQFKSDAFAAIHSSAQALRRVGAIDKATMRQFDTACLAPVMEFMPRDIRQLREANKVSQPVFARYLNTSPSTIEKWEAGAKRPSGMALKLLTLVKKHGIEVLA